MNVVDDDGAIGNLDDLTKSLREEAASLAAPDTKQQQAASAPADVPDDIPEKFRGKSVKDIVEAYKNLESQHGRMANDLGQQRNLTDRLLNLKRDNDLGQNGADASPATPKIKATDLAEDPQGAIEKVVKATIAQRDTQSAEEARQLRQQAAAAKLVQDHPDYQNYANSQEFTAWIQASSSRKRAAAQAQAGDFDAGNELLSEYKEAKKLTNQTGEQERLAAARGASLESGAKGAGGDSKGGKVYRRADLLRLQVENPDLYYSDDYQAVILKAYHEKRVK